MCCGEDWEEAEEEDWTAQIEAATAHCLLRAEAGREEAWERREPVGVVRIAAVMEGDKLARRKVVTRFVRRRGGGGGRGRGGEGLDIVGLRRGGGGGEVLRWGLISKVAAMSRWWVVGIADGKWE